MVARVLQLRFALFLGSFRGTAGAVARQVIGLVVLAGLVAAACLGTLSLADGMLDVASAVLTLTGAALLVGFAVGPFLASATDQLDPRRFAVLGLDPRPLAGALTLASVFSIPSLALIVVDACAATVWARLGAPVFVAVISAVVHVVTCLVLARVAMAISSMVLRGRRTRELSSLFVLGIVVVVFPVVVFLASLGWHDEVPEQIERVMLVLAMTPLGAAAGAPGAVALGSATVGVLAVVIALATAALAIWWWFWLVGRMLSTVDNPAVVHERGGLGWFALAPGIAAGAIAARSVVYWFSDMRYMANLFIIPIAGLLPVVPLLVAGVDPAITALVPVPIMALFFGWVTHNDTAYDSSAIWMHIVTGVSGISDRVGRTVPVLLTAIPVLAVTIPISVAFYGRWAILPAMIGLVASLFLCGLGLSGISSAIAPYAVPTPGDGPFQQPQRSGAIGVWAQALVMGLSLILSAPTLWLTWRALTVDVSSAMTAQWVGLGTGIGVLVAGVVVGGLVFQRRESRIMEFAGTT